MEIFLEILKVAASLVMGGGIAWLFNFRRKKQRIDTKLALENYKDTDDFIQKATERMMKLSNDIIELQKQHLETQQLLNAVESKNRLLGAKIQRFKAACTCGAKDLLD